MRTIVIITLTTSLLSLGVACDENTASEAAPQEVAEAPIPELGVEDAARLFTAGEATPVDANSEQTRSDQGIIPNARLLTSSGRYDPKAELPADPSTQLVFYCGNSDCRASDGAAERARDAGYENVRILRAGIAGWAEAGQPTARPPST